MHTHTSPTDFFSKNFSYTCYCYQRKKIHSWNLSFQSFSWVQFFVTQWTVARQACLSITNSRSLLQLMSIESVMPSTHLILCHPLLLFSIFPSMRVFSNESVLHIRWPKYWRFSFSISQWIFKTDFLYDWQVWSSCSLRDSQESSPTSQFKSISSSALSFLYSPTITSIHDHWKNHSFGDRSLSIWQRFMSPNC